VNGDHITHGVGQKGKVTLANSTAQCDGVLESTVQLSVADCQSVQCCEDSKEADWIVDAGVALVMLGEREDAQTEQHRWGGPLYHPRKYDWVCDPWEDELWRAARDEQNGEVQVFAD
jgi:hypothetical protein